MDPEAYRYIDGLRIHKSFDEGIVRSVFSYRPRPDDVFISTYPKSGTTWIQYLVLSILNKGEPPKTATEFYLASPFLELLGAEAAEKMVRPGALKVHLPFHMVPYSGSAKYIYVARNPYDVCVSLYYQTKGYTPKNVRDVSFSRFHELFITGMLSWGDYFDHLLSWYKERDTPNMLFFTYEMMRKETNFWALKIADFLGQHYGDELRKDSALLRKVIDVCSVKSMKEVFNDSMPTVLNDLLNLPPQKALKSVEVLRAHKKGVTEFHEREGFIRKGVVGDFRAHFAHEQIVKTEAWIKKKSEGSDVMNLWSDIDLPRLHRL